MKISIFFATLVAVLVSGSLKADDGGGPCKPKVEARHAARKVLHECLDEWARDARPNDPDPSGDCSAKLSAFVQAAKDVKACRVSLHKK